MRKQYDLEDRALRFGQRTRVFVKNLPRTISTIEDGKQLIRSSGSIGANYIEANEALSQKDLVLRLKIARKEAKETRFWLLLIDCPPEMEKERLCLVQEATELLAILSSIIKKVS